MAKKSKAISDADQPASYFEPETKYTPHGTLTGWQRGMRRVLTRQPIPLTVMAASLVGPLLRFLPPGSETVLIELVGKHESGKSTLALAAASVWAGAPGEKLGGADSWNMTLAALTSLKFRAADGLLALDEVNEVGDPEMQRKLIRTAIFNLSSSAGKARFGDSAQRDQARSVLISTSNMPIAKRLNSGTLDDQAAITRMLTIMVPSGVEGGIFATIPDGFADTAEAINHIRSVVDQHYGVASRAFIEGLICTDDEKIRLRIKRYRGVMQKMAKDAGIESARHRDMLSSIYAAGKLAMRFGVFPKSWGFTVGRVLRAIGAKKKLRPEARVLAYVAKFSSQFIDMGRREIAQPLTNFAGLPGVTRISENGRELLVPVPAFNAHFKRPSALVTSLMAEGIIVGEGGSKPKNSIHAPRRFKTKIRVYRILLDRLQPQTSHA